MQIGVSKLNSSDNTGTGNVINIKTNIIYLLVDQVVFFNGNILEKGSKF